jgi:hypothetical protein
MRNKVKDSRKNLQMRKWLNTWVILNEKRKNYKGKLGKMLLLRKKSREKPS